MKTEIAKFRDMEEAANIYSAYDNLNLERQITHDILSHIWLLPLYFGMCT